MGLQGEINSSVNLASTSPATAQYTPMFESSGGQAAVEVPWERKQYKILQRGGGGRRMVKEKERNCQYIAFQTG